MYTVVRDTREQKNNGWLFPASDSCTGTEIDTLPTGDYTLRGYETVFVIERKGSIAEFAQNVVQGRFERELTRMQEFEHPFMVLEFEVDDIVNWPKTAGLPKRVIDKLRITPQFLLKRFNDFQVKYKTKIITAGANGRYEASSLFKRICEHVVKS
jgi:ERCC4 domain